MNQKVNEFKQRDEAYRNRLSSFLLYEGGLEIRKITSIKKHVFYVETTSEDTLILKLHQKLDVIKQQWDFFKQIQASTVVSFQRYPNGRKVIADGHYYWTIAPFIKGKKLQYKNKKDRVAAVETLHDFHDKAKHIHVSHPIKKDLFFVRWAHRLEAFKKTEDLFNEYGFELLYKDIIRTMTLHLQLVAQLSWDADEKEAQMNGKWVHGDVASHNFIRNSQTNLIDFDLLTCGSQLYDYIQLGQRLLPYIDWDFDELLTYQMVAERDIKKWLSAIFIPSDIIREWLYFLSQGSSSSIKQYLSKMEKTWIKRHFFLKNAKSMLKSI